MGKKYVSMQEELAARKAAAGIDEPARATINRKEPKKEALSAKFKGLLDKGTGKAKRQVRSRGQEGVPKIVEPKAEYTDLDEAVLLEQLADREDAEILTGEPVEPARPEDAGWNDDWEDDDEDVFSMGEGKGKALGSVIVTVVAMMVIAFAMMLFDDSDNDETDNWDHGEYYGLDDLTKDSTDEEIIARVDEALEDHVAPSEEELNQWLQDKSISSIVGKDIRYANVTAENKYIVVRAHFDDDDQWELGELCSEARDRLNDKLYDADFDTVPSVLIIARSLHGDELLYFSLDDDEYYL